MKYITILFFTCIAHIPLLSFSISPEPCIIYSIPDSIITQLSPAWLQYVGNRSRFSVCSGLSWFSNTHTLASVNLLEESMSVYNFDTNRNTLQRIIKYDNAITQLAWPENLDISPDGTLLAVSNSKTGKILIYQIDIAAQQLYPSPIASLGYGDHGLHGVRFTPDNHYLAYTTYDGAGVIHLFRITRNDQNQLSFDVVWTLHNEHEGFAPKGIDFSSDQRYLAVCLSSKNRLEGGETAGKLVIYQLDPNTGDINTTPLCIENANGFLSAPEDILFSPDNSCLVVSNQGNDTITVHQFDQTTGHILSNSILLGPPTAQLCVPHGIAFSPDGNYFGVSNYGNDKICIFTVH